MDSPRLRAAPPVDPVLQRLPTARAPASSRGRPAPPPASQPGAPFREAPAAPSAAPPSSAWEIEAAPIWPGPVAAARNPVAENETIARIPDISTTPPIAPPGP